MLRIGVLMPSRAGVFQHASLHLLLTTGVVLELRPDALGFLVDRLDGVARIVRKTGAALGDGDILLGVVEAACDLGYGLFSFSGINSDLGEDFRSGTVPKPSKPSQPQ